MKFSNAKRETRLTLAPDEEMSEPREKLYLEIRVNSRRDCFFVDRRVFLTKIENESNSDQKNKKLFGVRLILFSFGFRSSFGFRGLCFFRWRLRIL